MNYFGKLDLITDSSIMSKDEYKKKICKKIQKKEKMFKSHFNQFPPPLHGKKIPLDIN